MRHYMRYIILLFLLGAVSLAQPGRVTRGYEVLRTPGYLKAKGLDTLDLRGNLLRVDNFLVDAFIDSTPIDVVCDTADAYKRITTWTVNLDDSWDADTTKGEFTVPRSGIYRVFAQLSFAIGTANRTAHAALYQNESKQMNLAFQRTLATSGSYGSASFGGFVYLTSGAKVTMRIRCEGGTATFTINHGQLTLEFIR